MLPGFRFLLAAIVLSFSTLVFGLGAAALLRASHERFASLPATPPAPALPRTATADAPTPDAAPPTLALLRVDAPVLDAAPRSTPTPVTGPIAPAPETTDITVAPPSPDLSAPDPKPAPAVAKTTSGSSRTIDEGTTEKVASPATPSSQPDTRQTAVETPAGQPETLRPEPTVKPTDITKVEPAQAQPASPQRVQAETVQQAEPAQPKPANIEVAKIEAATVETTTPRIPDVAMTQETRPAPLPPTDAPIKTAMLTPTEPASSAIPDPAVAISGPIPLPRSREWALAQGHAVRQPVRKRTAAVRARPRAVVRQPVRPQTQAPASAPNLLFPFGQ